MAVGGGSALPWCSSGCSAATENSLVTQPCKRLCRRSAMTPALQVMDVLQHGISLRCWDRRLQNQRCNRCFCSSRPTPQPLELVLASRADQACVELQLGTPSGESRAEVVLSMGCHVRQRAGEASVRPWNQPAL